MALSTTSRGGRRGSERLVLAFAALVVTGTAPAGAEWIRLSQGAAWSDVYSSVISPDGRWVVYQSDSETDNAVEIWSVRLPAGVPVKLSGNLPSNLYIGWLGISPDSARAVYMAMQDTDGVVELYSVPIGGPASAGVQLNAALVTGGNVGSFRIAADSTHVVYTADQDVDEMTEIYAVPIAGPATSGVQLNNALVAAGDVSWVDYAISPDSSRVIYLADEDTPDAVEIFSVSITGQGANIKLNPGFGAGHAVVRLQISPDGERVVYVADQETDGVFELYSVPIAGPSTSGVKLNGAMVAGGDVEIFAISPDSGRVVYWADQQVNEERSLYSVPIAGPAASGLRLNAALVAGGDVEGFAIAPDSSRVVYRADQEIDEVWELFSVPIAGPSSAGIQLNGALVPGGDVSGGGGGGFAISPDSAWVVYVADQEVDGWLTGHRAPLAGPAASDEQIWYSAYRPLPYFEILASSQSVAVLGNAAFVDGIERIWTYPLAGDPDPQGNDWLSGAFQANGDCASFRVLPGDLGVVYVADQQVDSRNDLYVLYFRLWGDDFEVGDTSRWSLTVP